MKVSIQVYLLSMLVISVINNTQTSGAVNYTYRLNMKVSSILAISVISNTLIIRVLEDIFRLNMKVQSILVISVTIKLHIMVK